ncbi:unnamed protein product (macronuclear) [Paramecium tetraurelia]|uniref:Protein kinase domain-containing protein n=1 Tax=Paramecium tetraurelia TaxID=5888 RepID=A0CDC2_PARTE|nr:uncharacterized protein GSPATT00007000001 [Paramecium tetraurelia]CAK68789.1 unnamed protein product [Paramecium tetraurelia]|eukprot:XP_001436186.1 hypothetical protein (macronuclear) [Paramecium tetraurelia strain d4-2]
MLVFFLCLGIVISGDVKLYSKYDTLLQDKLLIVTKNGLIYKYDLKYQQIRWRSELGISLQSDGIQNGTYFMKPYKDGSFLFYDEGFYEIPSEDLDILFKTCNMFHNSLTYNNELMYFLDIATGNIKELTQYDIQQLLSQPKMYEKGVLIHVKQKFISDLEYEDSQQHNSRIQINFLLKYLRGDLTQAKYSNSTIIYKTNTGIQVQWANKTLDLYLDDEVFEIFEYTPDQGIYSILFSKDHTKSTGLTVMSIVNNQYQCELEGQCQFDSNSDPHALGVYKDTQFKQCLNQFYKIKFQTQLVIYQQEKTSEKVEQCQVVENYTNQFLSILLLSMVIAYIPLLSSKKKQKPKEVVIVKEPQVQYIYIKSKEIQINKERILGIGMNGTCVYEGIFQGKMVAVKEINLKNLQNKYLEKLLEESISKQMLLNSPQINKLFFFEKRNDCLYLAMEKCMINLREFIKYESCQKLNEAQKLNIKQNLQNPEFYKEIFLDLLNALQTLLENNTQHHGITPDNVLFSQDLKIKLADFGLSTLTDYYQENPNDKKVIKKINYSMLQQVGLIFYFLLSKGDDFSQKQAIDQKFLMERFKKFNIKELETKDLLMKLLLDQSIGNPQCIFTHPYFWTKQKKLSFICEFSDYVETYPLPNDQVSIHDRFIANSVFKDNWGTRCGMILKCQIRGYDQTQAQQLIRLIRNTKNHYHQLTEDCKLLLGPTDETCFDYWSKQFPNLFFTLYQHAIENSLNLLSLK